MTITDEESYEYARRFGTEEGILVGISSGANIAAAIKIAKELGKGKKSRNCSSRWWRKIYIHRII